MRHPALVRVFAVVLVILSLVMLAAGVLGLQKARDDYYDNLAAADKMLADIEEYKTLMAENEGKEDYDTVSESLNQLQEQHEDVSAEHRTDLAVYSATKGGIDGAVDMLDEADIAMAQARAQFEAGKAEFETKKAAFMKMYNDYQQALAAYDPLKNAVSEMQAVVDNTNAEVLEATKQTLDSRAAAFEEKHLDLEARKAAEAENPEDIIDESLESDLAIFAEEKAAFETGRAEFMLAYNGYYQAAGALPAMKEQLAQLELAVNSGAEIEAGKAQLDAAEQALIAGEEQLNSAEYSLYYQRALIWNEIAKLEEQAVELEETKNQLLDESQEIAQKEQLSEEQKQREKRIRSLYLTFMDKPEIEEAVNNGEDFVTAVEAYIVRFNDNNHKESTYRGYACILMAVSILPCLVSFISSFEIIKKTGFARSGAVIVLLCAAGALGLLLYIGRGVSYSAAAVAFFAFIQILVSGRKKPVKVK